MKLEHAPLTLDQYRQDRIVLEDFVRVGDIVIVAKAKDGDASYYHLPPEGTRWICVGHNHFFDYCGRESRFNKEPGIYLRYGHARYETVIDGQVVNRSLSPHHLIFADPTLDPQKTRRDDAVWQMFKDGIRMGDLPELPVYPGDVVEVFGNAREMFKDHGYRARVEGINYWKNSDGVVEPTLRLEPLEHGWTTGANPDQVRLDYRGNFYHWEHDHSKLGFADLAEEVSFYTAVSEVVQMKNSSSGNYGWTNDEIIKALEAGEVDFFHGHALTRKNRWAQRSGRPEQTVWPYRFKNNPMLAKRTRAVLLEAMKGPVLYGYNNDALQQAEPI